MLLVVFSHWLGRTKVVWQQMGQLLTTSVNSTSSSSGPSTDALSPLFARPQWLLGSLDLVLKLILKFETIQVSCSPSSQPARPCNRSLIYLLHLCYDDVGPLWLVC
jgi:hypothetical protein